MTRYAAVIVAALVIRSATGGWVMSLYAAGCLLLAGVILDGGLRWALRSAKAGVPKHRQPLDVIVRKQWLGAGLLGILVALGVGLSGVDTLHLDRFLNAVVTAGTLAVIAIYISSLIDWHWILPRVSGVVRQAPCEAAGGQRWARVTGVWLFHRAVATLLVTGALSGVLLYMSQTSDDDNEKTIWLVASAIVTAAVLAFNAASLRSLWLAFNPRLHVGDILDLHGRPCYVVDVSLQGAKYMIVDGRERSQFSDKYDGSFSLEEFSRYPKVVGASPPCRDRCTKVNWYCRHNPHAHD